jgi:hypothetical protein
MLRTVAMGVVGLVGVAIAVGLALPRTWRVERAIVIEAPTERIVPAISTLRRWQNWAPWARTDPKAVHHFVGPESGVGARWQWTGPTLGPGALTIVAAAPTAVDLEAALASEDVNARQRFTFVPEGDGTRVTWVDEGTLPRLGGFFTSSVEARLSRQLEVGLSNLKAVVEREPAPRPLPPASSLEGLDAGLSAGP